MRGLGGYAAMIVALIAAAWLVLIDYRALAANGVIVLSEPFKSSMSAAILILALFTAVTAAVSAARDRETGTLEVLFYGPVDEITYVLGKATGLAVTYAAALPFVVVGFLILALLTNFVLTLPVIFGLVASVVPAAEFVLLGVLLAVGADRVRTAVLLLIAVIALLLGISISYKMVLLVPIENPSSPALSLRDALAALNYIVSWVSPFAYLERIVDSAASGVWRASLANAAASLGFTAGMAALAAYWLRRRGVYRRGE